MSEENKEYEPKEIKLPRPVNRVWLVHHVAVTTSREIPNAWRRFWHWALLGWRWEKIKGDT